MSRDAFLRRTNGEPGRTPSHHRSKKQEKELAARIGGRKTPASGAGYIKGDIRKKGVVRIEAKTTKNKSFSITREMVDKIEHAALSCDELPVIVVEFIDDYGRVMKEVAVVPTYVLATMGYRE